MGDIRDRLNVRRDNLMQSLSSLEAHVDGGADPTSRAYEVGRRGISELLEIEGILAQMQTADAQRALADAQREVASAQRESTAASESERSWSDGRDFWLRRFFTSVAVANGAGAFASVSVLLRPDPPAADAVIAALVVGCFVGGVAIAGLLPLALAARPKFSFEEWPWPIVQWLTVLATGLAALLFIVGCSAVLLVGFRTLDRNLEPKPPPPRNAASASVKPSIPNKAPPTQSHQAP